MHGNKNNLKLDDIITLLDPLDHVIIWVNYDNEDLNDDETPDFEGSIMDIPWYFLDYPINADTDREIRIGESKDRNYPFFVINLNEPKE